MTIESSRVASATTLSFSGQADLKVSDDASSGVFVRIKSVSARVGNVPAFLELLKSDPEQADARLTDLVAAVSSDISAAMSHGAAGILYWIEGACPRDFTPMQYGGLFLELDRDLLTSAREKGDTVVFIADEDEPYIDVVSDLPADLFGWDAACGVSPTDIRPLRSGRMLADHPDADVRFVGPVPARRTP
ncbi:MAG: hypothetical protein JSS65_02870 [Armatimonadetes bacterium]|nr:hypothetical protein [Armatimonadota bacterium]